MSHSIGHFLVCGDRQQDVQIARTDDDLRKIGELRYSLYVARDKKAYPAADHGSRCFNEPIDQDSLNLFGVIQDSCVTTMRVTKARSAVRDASLHRVLKNSPFETSAYDRLMVVSRLATVPNTASRTLMLSMIRESYRISSRNGIAFTVIATRKALVRFFLNLGFLPSGNSFTETIAGELHVMVLDMFNQKHLESMQSTFVDLLEEFKAEHAIDGRALA